MKTKVKELRTAAGMTQQQLAERVHVSARTIISIEKEQYSPSLMLAYRMAEVFGVTVEELCCLRENRGMGGPEVWGFAIRGGCPVIGAAAFGKTCLKERICHENIS